MIVGSILDKNCRIGRDVHIETNGDAPELDAEPCCVRDGIPVVIKESTIPDGWRLPAQV